MAKSNRICFVDGCSNPTGVPGTARGLCRAHYRRLLRHGDPNAGGTPMNARSKWIEEYKDFGGSDCLPWPFGKTGSGYAQFRLNGVSTLGSHAMCIAAHGEPPTSSHQAAH